MKNSFSLKEISQWCGENSNVLIPPIQRGLVWKPRQVEFLWDSILRGFPIGSFMLSDIKDNPNKYYLMDGQQRYNAIALGYTYSENSNAILWIDVSPEFSQSSTRKFLIRVTTTAHPWGYGKDEQCTPLKTAERRIAIDSYNLTGSIYEHTFSLKQTWPWCANKPIPLSIVTSAALDSPDIFYEDIVSLLLHSHFAIKDKLNFNEDDKKYIQGILYPTILTLNKYLVHCNHLPLSVIDNETSENIDDKSNLEILFERINVNGTRISNEDLYYSSIKAYWINIREENDKLSQSYGNPAKLAMLAFRLCLTEPWAAQLRDTINLASIRRLSMDIKKKEEIESFYTSGMYENILLRIDEWMGVNEESILRMPIILRTTIIYKCPDLYLLLMIWAKLSILNPEAFLIEPHHIKAIMFVIRWFSVDANAVIRNIMLYTSEEKHVDLSSIQKALGKSIYDGSLIQIYPPDEVRKFFVIGNSPKWSPFGANSGPWRDFYWRISSSYCNDYTSEMILYAQRGYINSHFANYNPARLDMWESYNRPWDFDHIVAQNRVKGRWGKYREYDYKWLNTIGNIAAISYEANRSKQDSMDDYTEYQKNRIDLLYDEMVEELTDFQITNNQEQSYKFALITFNRLVNIYQQVYELISPVVSKVVLTKEMEERKVIFEYIENEISDAHIHFVAEDNEEYEYTRPQDLCREWLSVGVIKGNMYASLAWDARKDNVENFEIGIRKAPHTKVEMDDDLASKLNQEDLLKDYDCDGSEWWYVYKTIPISNVKETIQELIRLVHIINKLTNKSV